MGETAQMAEQAGNHQPSAAPRVRDNPADDYELTTVTDVRCRSCGKIAARGVRGDGLKAMLDTAKSHDCPMALSPGDWLAVVTAGYEAYRGTEGDKAFAGVAPWSSAPLPVQFAWREAATAIVREYLARRNR